VMSVSPTLLTHGDWRFWKLGSRNAPDAFRLRRITARTQKASSSG
jgi:hypothetical protein